MAEAPSTLMLMVRLGVSLCLVLALGVAWFLTPDPTFSSVAVLAIAVTSTALGTLLPILKERGELGTPLGAAVLTHGAVGEQGARSRAHVAVGGLFHQTRSACNFGGWPPDS